MVPSAVFSLLFICSFVFLFSPLLIWAFQVVLLVKNLSANAGDVREAGLIPGWGRSPGGGHGNPLQYPWTEELGGPQSIGSQRVGHN